jgi:resuscitation-promoting factor RpfB
MLTFTPTGAVISEETILDTNDGGFYGWWGMDFAWSPDGALLAYARPDEIGLVDIKNKTTRPLVTILPFQTGSDWAWVPGISWSPDHNVLFTVTHAPKAGIDSQEASPLFDLSGLAIDSDVLEAGGPLISIIPQAGMFAYPVASPIWKKNGYPVAFLQAIFPEQSDSKRYRLVVMDRDGSNQERIFPAEDRQGLEPQYVSWSPQPFGNDQLWLALIYQGNIWFVNSDTGESQQVTGDGLITHLDWK